MKTPKLIVTIPSDPCLAVRWPDDAVSFERVIGDDDEDLLAMLGGEQ